MFITAKQHYLIVIGGSFMVDFILSDVVIQSTISTVPSSLKLCDVTLPEVIVCRAS